MRVRLTTSGVCRARRGRCRFPRAPFVSTLTTTKEADMQYLLLIYGPEAHWATLSEAEAAR